MKQLMRSFIAYLCLILLASGACAASATDAVGKALERAERALTQAELRGDVGFWVGQGARLAKRRPEITLMPDIVRDRYKDTARYEYGFWVLRNATPRQIDSSVLAAEDKAFEADFLDDPFDNKSPKRVQKAYKVLKLGFDCSKADSIGLLFEEPDYGYVATHQLIALIVASHKGCIDESQHNQYAHPLVARITNEMQSYSATVGDLQVERAALLAIIGRADLVPDALVTELLRLQHRDGIWVFDDAITGGANVAAHNTALAYVVLAARLASQ